MTTRVFKAIDKKGRELERFINMTDNQIFEVASALQPWEPRNVRVAAPKSINNDKGFIEWKVNPTYAGAALMVKDMMILKIISDAQWRFPIYFAVTVPAEKLPLPSLSTSLEAVLALVAPSIIAV